MAELFSSTQLPPTISTMSSSLLPSLTGGGSNGGISAAAKNITQFVEHPGIFLQSSSAKIIAGIFAWTALCITCHQVTKKNIRFQFERSKIIVPFFLFF